MRLWLSKNSEVPIREQLVTQVILGITSGDLAPGARLPSTREVARRFRVHANTVSAAYRELTERGWIELRSGSGVYVRALDGEEPQPDSNLELDRLIANFLREARARGYTRLAVQRRVEGWLALQPPDHFLVIESDEELRRILEHEITKHTSFPVRGIKLDELREADLAGAAPVTIYSQAESVRARLPAGTTLLPLHTRSVPDALRGEQPPAADALITVISGWQDFLRYARNVLLAAGLDPEALDFRHTSEADWRRGLRASSIVITDQLTAASLPAGTEARIFTFISDSSLQELRSFVDDFLT